MTRRHDTSVSSSVMSARPEQSMNTASCARRDRFHRIAVAAIHKSPTCFFRCGGAPVRCSPRAVLRTPHTVSGSAGSTRIRCTRRSVWARPRSPQCRLSSAGSGERSASLEERPWCRAEPSRHHPWTARTNSAHPLPLRSLISNDSSAPKRLDLLEARLHVHAEPVGAISGLQLVIGRRRLRHGHPLAHQRVPQPRRCRGTGL